jgi:L-amino acid N-acyltransferase YncA
MAMELRVATLDDAAAVAAVYRPYVASTPISLEIDPPDENEMRRRMHATLTAYPWLVCEQRGELVGYAYGGQHGSRAGYRWSVDTSVYIHSSFHRRGVGRGLYTSLFRILAAQGFVSAYAGVTLPNPGSVAIHESFGFRPVGVYRNAGFKAGTWYDVGWWQRALQAPPASPPPALTFGEVRRDSAWPEMLASGLSCIRD